MMMLGPLKYTHTRSATDPHHITSTHQHPSTQTHTHIYTQKKKPIASHPQNSTPQYTTPPSSLPPALHTIIDVGGDDEVVLGVGGDEPDGQAKAWQEELAL